ARSLFPVWLWTCGGLIRGGSGECLGDFARGLGECSVLAAELWGVLEGVCSAGWSMFRKIKKPLQLKDDSGEWLGDFARGLG
ncbi:hypothetical protein A2U01_0009116, partial [Trifolium medium]|nr:hypothetical protein [Trifolium medium]